MKHLKCVLYSLCYELVYETKLFNLEEYRDILCHKTSLYRKMTIRDTRARRATRILSR